MKNKVTQIIKDFVKEYEKQEHISTRWGEPLVGFADAKHPFILSLKDIIGPNHGTPDEVLYDASIVIAYYFPFTKELADTNNTDPAIAS
ncbi:MAG: epoxyqueuosine reductase, partial [Clostridiales bacterium]|nr:epoxyqueuosine reductase [Clostridiales bacterium]